MGYPGVELIDEILLVWPRDERPKRKRACTHRRAGRLVKGKVYCKACGAVVKSIAR